MAAVADAAAVAANAAAAAFAWLWDRREMYSVSGSVKALFETIPAAAADVAEPVAGAVDVDGTSLCS